MLNLIFPMVMLSILVAMIVFSLGYHHTARLFPLLIILPVAVLLILQIAREIRVKMEQKAETGERAPAGQAGLGAYLKSQLWVVLLLLSIYLIGFVAGTALFILAYLRVHGVGWQTTAICIAVVATIVYGAFGLLFEVYLYKGVLLDFLR